MGGFVSSQALSEAVLQGRGSAGAWYVVPTLLADGVRVNRLWHYSTCMLTWRNDKPTDEDYLDYSLGHGSVSDQRGMNYAFKALGIPRYFQRSIALGGPQIIETDPANAEELRLVYLKMREQYSWVR